MTLKFEVDSLWNDYYVMRHGESYANKLGIVISSLEMGKRKEYGLTELGQEQVRNSAGKNWELGAGTLVISSPFSRTMETARIACNIFGTYEAIIDARLRERFFGIFDFAKNTEYKNFWEQDKNDADYHGHGGESVNDVLKRMLSLITLLEYHHTGKKILLVSHGDPLQILQCYFERIPPNFHRQIKHLENAEIRRLN